MTNVENEYAIPSFVQGQDYWPLPETGNWSADCAAGRAAGADLLRVMFFQDASPMLGFVVRAMVEKGRFGGVEAGFCQVIAEAVTQ